MVVVKWFGLALLVAAVAALLWWSERRYRRHRDEHLKNTGYGFLLDRDDDKKV